MAPWAVPLLAIPGETAADGETLQGLLFATRSGLPSGAGAMGTAFFKS